MKLPFWTVALSIGVIASSPAFGQFTQITTPDSSYTSSTTVLPITAADNAAVSSLTDGTLTVTLTPSLQAHTVPGGGWSTWNTPPNVESVTPRVAGVYSSLTTFTLSLSSPRNTFGFEAEPDTFSVFTFTATFMNGSTVLGTVTRSLNGSAGALLFAATSATPITSVVLTTPAGANGFAIAQVRAGGSAASAVPALGAAGTSIMTILLLAAGSLILWRRNTEAF